MYLGVPAIVIIGIKKRNFEKINDK